MGVYALVTSIYEVPKRHKVNKYYSISIKITDEGVKKEFNASVLCKHNMGVNAGVGWWDRYETKVQNILIKNDSDSNEWQLTGIYCPNPHVNIMPRGIYKKTKTGQIYYFPLFFGQEKETVSIDWSLAHTPKYKVYKKESTILGEENKYPIAYMYKVMKLRDTPEALEKFNKPTVIGRKAEHCKSNFSRQKYSNEMFNVLNDEYIQRGFLNYEIESDIWSLDKSKIGYRFIDVIGKNKNGSNHSEDDCINLRIDNTVYSVVNHDYIWIPDERLLIQIKNHNSGSDYLRKNMYIDVFKECDNVPLGILKEIDRYQNFQELRYWWIPDNKKNKQFETFMKVDGTVHCIKWPRSVFDYYGGW